MKAHFDFALFVLEILAEINTIFQEKYGFLPYFVEYISSLGVFLGGELRKIGKWGLWPFSLFGQFGAGQNRPIYQDPEIPHPQHEREVFRFKCLTRQDVGQKLSGL